MLSYSRDHGGQHIFRERQEVSILRSVGSRCGLSPQFYTMLSLKNILESATGVSYDENVTVLVLRAGLVLVLSAITVFRREMSCNHCYAEATEASSTWDDEETDQILDRAGCYCSGASLSPLLAKLREVCCKDRPFSSLEQVLDATDQIASILYLTDERLTPPRTLQFAQPNPLTNDLPADALVHIASYLLPREVCTLACVDRSSREFIQEGESSVSVWKNLWQRDYEWAMTEWEVGREALERSGASPQYSREFYFRFGLGFVNYVLAGCNRMDQCLLGLRGHIYDISGFLLSHPGSPETVMVQAGKDATSIFDGIMHSMGARNLAQSMCVLVDRFQLGRGSCGMRPTRLTGPTARGTVDEPPIGMTMTTPRSNCLKSLYDEFHTERREKHKLARRRAGADSISMEVQVYYDPYNQDWRGWYTNHDLETVLLTSL